MENLFKNQGLLWWLIVSLILVTLMFESTVILYGQIRSQSLVGIEGLRRHAISLKPSFSPFLSIPTKRNTTRDQHLTHILLMAAIILPLLYLL